jgi:uncharacterized membrane protein YidH (DUF202 family)
MEKIPIPVQALLFGMAVAGYLRVVKDVKRNWSNNTPLVKLLLVIALISFACILLLAVLYGLVS